MIHKPKTILFFALYLCFVAEGYFDKNWKLPEADAKAVASVDAVKLIP